METDFLSHWLTTYNHHRWSRQKLGVRNSAQVSHMGGWAKHLSHYPVSQAAWLEVEERNSDEAHQCGIRLSQGIS